MRKPDPGEWKIEHDIFHMLVRRYKRPDLNRVYLAIQSALAYQQTKLDVGWLMGQMVAEGRGTILDRYCDPIGPEGLAFFHFLFQTELVEEGLTDYHTYRFTRRYDGATVLAYMKTASDPSGVRFKRDYHRQLSKLDRSRDHIVATHDWVKFSDWVKRVFPDIEVIDLDKETGPNNGVEPIR